MRIDVARIYNCRETKWKDAITRWKCKRQILFQGFLFFGSLSCFWLVYKLMVNGLGPSLSALIRTDICTEWTQTWFSRTWQISTFYSRKPFQLFSFSFTSSFPFWQNRNFSKLEFPLWAPELSNKQLLSGHISWLWRQRAWKICSKNDRKWIRNHPKPKKITSLHVTLHGLSNNKRKLWLICDKPPSASRPCNLHGAKTAVRLEMITQAFWECVNIRERCSERINLYKTRAFISLPTRLVPEKYRHSRRHFQGQKKCIVLFPRKWECHCVLKIWISRGKCDA